MTTVLDSLKPGVILGDFSQLIIEELEAGLWGTSIFNLTKFSKPEKLLLILNIGEQFSSVPAAVDGLPAADEGPVIIMSLLKLRFLTVNLGFFFTGALRYYSSFLRSTGVKMLLN